MALWIKMLVGLFAGAIVGAVLGPHGTLFKPIGDAFLNLINMIIAPLVLSSTVLGVTSVCNNKKICFVAMRTLVVFFGMTISAVVLGIVIAKLFDLGKGLHLALPLTFHHSDSHILGNILTKLVPQNPISALVDGNVLQIVVFAFCLGVAINLAGERGRLLTDFFESLADVFFKLTSIMMGFSPLGVFAITVWVVGTFGLTAFYIQLEFLILYYLTSIFFVVAVFCSILWFGAKVHPWPLFKGMIGPIVFAGSTCSSSATLPLSMSSLQEKVGVSRNVVSLVMPMGSVLNMNGAAILQGMGAVFVAQAYGIEFGWTSTLFLAVVGVFSVVGASGVPGSGLLMLSYAFNVLGIPLEGLALFIGIDRGRDMCSTVLNVLGNAVCAVYIARTEGVLDERQYYSERAIVIEGDEV